MNISHINDCCGCRACEHICSKKAISFSPNAEGFLVPIVDSDKCVECGVCYNKCPQAHFEEFNTNMATYAALNRKKEIIFQSSSGGAMSAFAKVILDEGGSVFGTYLNTDDWKCYFKEVTEEGQLAYLQGSKYVQSDTGDVYSTVKQRLGEGKTVLFIGVPCQVAGLISYLGSRPSKLYTIDILCHGTPAPELFVQHIRFLEKKYGKKMTNFSFRDKTKFPSKVALKYEFGNKKKYILGKCERYFQAFISGSAYRESCYDCHYAQRKRVGDITLGDYWGIRNVHKDFDSSLGASLVLVNSHAGKELLNKAELVLEKSDIEQAVVGNGILERPSSKAKNRDTFYLDIKNLGYEKALKKNTKVLPKIYNGVLTHLPQSVIGYLSKLK